MKWCMSVVLWNTRALTGVSQVDEELRYAAPCWICYMERVTSYRRVTHYVYAVLESVPVATDCFVLQSLPHASATDISQWSKEIRLARVPSHSQRYSNRTLCNNLVPGIVGNFFFIATKAILHHLQRDLWLDLYPRRWSFPLGKALRAHRKISRWFLTDYCHALDCEGTWPTEASLR
jgi:hypothetical protein